MPRYVILEHDWPTLHWDVFLECGDVLKAWKVHQRPAPGTPFPLLAESNHDHRRIYLDYEGPVSGGRGGVRRVDHGEYHITQDGYSLRSEAWGWQVELTVVGDRWWLRILPNNITS